MRQLQDETRDPLTRTSWTTKKAKANKARYESSRLYKSIRGECFHLRSRSRVVSGSLSESVQEACFKKKFYVRIFTDKKSLDVIILPIIWGFKFLLLSHFHLMFLPTNLITLPPGVMLLNRSTAPRDSTTDVEKKHPRKGHQSESDLIEV